MQQEDTEKEYVSTQVSVLDCKFQLLENNIQSTNIDADFFNPSYTVAAHTGNYVWEGCWVFVDFLKEQLGDKIKGKRIIELGSGTGLLGLAIAVFGGHVMCTDLEPIVKGILNTNLVQNSIEGELVGSWKGSRKVANNNGSVASMPLDWTIELEKQIIEPFEFDFVFAAETVWLAELICPFVDTFVALLKKSGAKTGYFEFLDRSISDTPIFASIKDIFSQFERHHCVISSVYSKLSPKYPGVFAHIYQISL